RDYAKRQTLASGKTAANAKTSLADAIAICATNSEHANESSSDASTKPNSPIAPSPSFAAAVISTSNLTTASMAPPLVAFLCSTNWPKTSDWSRPSIDSYTSLNCTCLTRTLITSSTSPSTLCATALAFKTLNCAATTPPFSIPSAPSACPIPPPPASIADVSTPTISTSSKTFSMTHAGNSGNNNPT